MQIVTHSFINKVLIDFGMSQEELLDEMQATDPLEAAAVLVYDVLSKEESYGTSSMDVAELEMDNFVVRYDRWTLGFGPSDEDNDEYNFYDIVEFASIEDAKDNIYNMKEGN